MNSTDDQEKDNKKRKATYLSTLSVTIFLTLLCFVIQYIVQYFEKDFTKTWNNDLATMMATSPNIAPPGDCGSSISCFAPFPVENYKISAIGTEIQVGYFAITVTNAGQIENDNYSLGDNQILWAIDFKLIYTEDGNPHYGGPVYESILQGKDNVYELVATEPEDLNRVLKIYPGDEISGRLIYAVPYDEYKLYWFHENRMTHDPIAVFDVR